MFHVKHPYAMGRARTMTKKLLMGNEAFAHAALEAGVRVVAGYPGTPSSELIETVAKLHDDGAARGIHVEWSTNEKSALELLAGASYTGARCLFTCKQVGLNVASDALMSLNYVGVKGGMVLFVADDPGPISSQTEQDTRRFASFAKLPVLDPATPDQGFAMMQAAFDLSERYHTPVIVRPTTRINHASTFFDVADATDARPVPDEGFERDPKWVIFPRRAYQAHGEINERLAAIAHDFAVEPALAAFNPMVEGGAQSTEDARTNVSRETFDDGSMPKTATSAGAKAVGIGAGASESAAAAVAPRLGIVAGGVSAAYAREALRMVEARAAAAGVEMPAYRFWQVGTPYPFPEELAATFAEGLDEVLVLEELDHVLEDALLVHAGRTHASYEVRGRLTGDAGGPAGRARPATVARTTWTIAPPASRSSSVSRRCSPPRCPPLRRRPPHRPLPRPRRPLFRLPKLERMFHVKRSPTTRLPMRRCPCARPCCARAAPIAAASTR